MRLQQILLIQFLACYALWPSQLLTKSALNSKSPHQLTQKYAKNERKNLVQHEGHDHEEQQTSGTDNFEDTSGVNQTNSSYTDWLNLQFSHRGDRMKRKFNQLAQAQAQLSVVTNIDQDSVYGSPHHEDFTGQKCQPSRYEAPSQSNLRNELTTTIKLLGPQVVLVNLDDEAQCEQLETNGIFVQSGDMIFLTAQVNQAAGQQWVESDDIDLNYKIVQIIQDEDIVLKDKCGHETGEVQTLEILQAMSTGKTTYGLSLLWGGIEVKRVTFDIYVNQQYCLCVVQPRNQCCNHQKENHSYSGNQENNTNNFAQLDEKLEEAQQPESENEETQDFGQDDWIDNEEQIN
eukprot:403376019